MKVGIRVHPEKCAECMCCQLICSLTYFKSFNPEKARIVINPPNEIRFTEECVEGCTLCTKYCLAGAIVATKKEG
jgi:Pyruvate/2-oxoacid:ferredoxin oxidoreductase delta subunit